MMRPMLVVTPAPRTTESLLGYVLRVSEENGYETPRSVFAAAGVSRDNRRTCRRSLAQIAETTNQNLNALARIAYYQDVDPRTEACILGHPLQARQLRIRNPQICPQCIQQKGFIEAHFDLVHMSVCPEHGTILISSCPHCGKYLNWYRPGLLICSCGYDLGQERCSPAAPEFVGLMQVVRAVTLRLPLLSDASCSLPAAELTALSLESLLGMISLLGARFLDCLVFDQPPHVLAAAAAQVLANWPTQFHDLIRRHRSLRDASTVRNQFISLYRALFRTRRMRKAGSAGNFLLDEFVRFCLEDYGQAFIDPTMTDRGRVTNHRRFVGITELCRQLDCSHAFAKRLLASGTVQSSVVTTSNRTRIIADISSAHVPRRTPGATLRQDQAASRLGLSASVFRLLRKWGVYKANHRAPYGNFSCHEADLDVFLNRGFALVQPSSSTEASPPSLISLKRALGIRHQSVESRARMVRAVFEGQIRVIARSDNTLAGLMLAEPDVTYYRNIHEPSDGHQVLTYREVETTIGIPTHVIPAAIKHGLLDGVPANTRSRLGISAASLQHFSEIYLALRTLASALGTTTRVLNKFCRDCEVPVIRLPYPERRYCHSILRRTDESLVRQLWHARPRPNRVRRRVSPTTALKGYLTKLRANNLLLPRYRGLPNKSRIADTCGIYRDAFKTRHDMNALLQSYDLEERSRVEGIGVPDHLGKLRRYLENLALTGNPLPRRPNGLPNKSAIARECQIPRRTLAENEPAKWIASVHH